MTEQIKSAIEELKTADEYCVIPSIKSRKLAIRSLQAWSEVLQELEELKKTAEKMRNYTIYKACEIAIDIINRHLEIEK